MGQSHIVAVLQKFFAEMQVDVVEERVLNYIIRELHLGRKLSAIIKDPYVANRLTEEQVTHILEKPELIEAVEGELEQAFKLHEFKFTD